MNWRAQAPKLVLVAFAVIAALWIGVANYLNERSNSDRGSELATTGSSDVQRKSDEPVTLDNKAGAGSGSPADAPETRTPEARASSSGPENEEPSGTRPYGGMIPGRTRLSLSRDTPIEWIRKCLEAVDRVESISIRTNLLTPELIDLIAEIGNVREIKTGTVGLSAEAAEALARLAGVAEIDLTGGAFEFTTAPSQTRAEFHKNVESYLAMPDLDRFETWHGFQVSDDVLRAVGGSQTITELVMRNNDDTRRKNEITAQGLREIGRMRQLRALHLHAFGPSLDRGSIEDLDEMLLGLPNLEELSLHGWPVEDRHLRDCLPTLQRLKYLDIRGTKVSQQFYSLIDHSWSLEALLASKSFGDASAEAIAVLPNLTRLEIPSSAVSGIGLEALRKSLSLATLNLNDAEGISAASIRSVFGAPSLRKLYLADVPGLSSSFLFELARDSMIRLLGLSEQDGVNRQLVTDIFTHTTVESLHVFKCKNLSTADIDQLRSQFPDKHLINARYYPD